MIDDMQNLKENNRQLYRIVFDGRETEGKNRKEAVEGLARLMKRKPNQVNSLFSDRPVVLKRGLTENVAHRYVRTIEQAGCVCHMEAETETSKKTAISTCPKCGYQAFQDSDTMVSRDECPSCGIILSKFIPPEGRDLTPDDVEQREYSVNEAPHEKINEGELVEFPDPGFLTRFFGFFLVQDSIWIDCSPEKLPDASIKQRIWAGVATFSHMLFVSYVFLIPIGILGGIYIMTKNVPLSMSFYEGLKDLAVFLACIYIFLLLPLSWKGHSFGMRLMGIVIVDLKHNNQIGIQRSDTLLRQAVGIVKLFVIPLFYPLLDEKRRALEDVVTVTRKAEAFKLSTHPWNLALRPLLAVVLFHFLIMVPGNYLLFKVADKYSTSVERPSVHKQAEITTPARSILLNFRTVLEQYIATRMELPASRSAMNEMLNSSLRPNNPLIRLYNKNALAVRGDIGNYEIGVLISGKWHVMDQSGKITIRDAF